MAQVRVRRRQSNLAKLIEVHLLVLRAIVLADDIVGIAHARAEIILAHEVVKLRDTDLAVTTSIQVLEKLHRLEIGVSTQVLSFHLDLSKQEQDKCEKLRIFM